MVYAAACRRSRSPKPAVTMPKRPITFGRNARSRCRNDRSRWAEIPNPTRCWTGSCRRTPPCAWRRARSKRHIWPLGRPPAWPPAPACRRSHADRRTLAARLAQHALYIQRQLRLRSRYDPQRELCARLDFGGSFLCLLGTWMIASRRKEPPLSAHSFNSCWDIAGLAETRPIAPMGLITGNRSARLRPGTSQSLSVRRIRVRPWRGPASPSHGVLLQTNAACATSFLPDRRYRAPGKANR